MGSYSELKIKFENLVGVTIDKHSFLDQLMYAFGELLDSLKKEIKDSKNPHIYSNLKGSHIDDVGMLVNCHRYENETDTSYFTRVISHATRNEACNRTSIEQALTHMTNVSHASYTPFTQGTGTATIHFIPKDYSTDTIQKGVFEIRERLKNVTSPDTYFKIESAKPVKVEVVAYILSDLSTSVLNYELELAIANYINHIAIGKVLSYGELNKIGLSIPGVRYFNTISIYLDKHKMEALEKTQTIKTKFLFESLQLEKVSE